MVININYINKRLNTNIICNLYNSMKNYKSKTLMYSQNARKIINIMSLSE